MQDETFTARMTVAERAACCSYVSVTREFLGNTKTSNYRNLVDVMLQNFQSSRCKEERQTSPSIQPSRLFPRESW